MAQLKIPLDAQRFSKGLSWKDYMAQMADTRARTEEYYSKSALTDDERKFFGSVNGVKYAMMLAENWCGDVHRNSPLLAHICEAIPRGVPRRRLSPRRAASFFSGPLARDQPRRRPASAYAWSIRRTARRQSCTLMGGGAPRRQWSRASRSAVSASGSVGAPDVVSSP